MDYEVSSGNVWADIGRADAEEALARAEMMSRITRVIHTRGWTEAEAVAILETDRETVVDLMRGKLSRFSIERLSHLARLLAKRS